MESEVCCEEGWNLRCVPCMSGKDEWQGYEWQR